MGLKVGQSAPDFDLADLTGNRHRLSDHPGRVVVLNFWSAECPWSEQADLEIGSYREAWGDRVVVFSIASNQNEDVAMISQTASARAISPILLDADAKVANLFAAQTTPHLFVIDKIGILRYQGAMNDITFRKRSAQNFYLRDAVNLLLDGHLPQISKTNPYGCTIVREI